MFCIMLIDDSSLVCVPHTLTHYTHTHTLYTHSLHTHTHFTHTHYTHTIHTNTHYTHTHTHSLHTHTHSLYTHTHTHYTHTHTHYTHTHTHYTHTHTYILQFFPPAGCRPVCGIQWSGCRFCNRDSWRRRRERNGPATEAIRWNDPHSHLCRSSGSLRTYRCSGLIHQEWIVVYDKTSSMLIMLHSYV